MAMCMERMSVSKAVTEIVDVMLLSAPDKDELSLSMKIYTTSKHFEDHDADILFHIKVQTNNKFDLESLLKKYGEHFKELSTLLTVMEQLEDTSHLCVQSVHDDNIHQVVLKNYKVCLTANDQNLPTELKCIGTTTKYKSSAQSMATTLHIRVYQEKTQMMIHSKWLYQYLRLVSFCSPKVQLDFTLKIHENLCVFDIRSPCTVTTNNGFEISGAATNYLKESEYQAVCPTVQPVSGDATLFLGVDIGLPTPENMLVSAVAFLSHCQSKNQLKSLATLSLYGPRCVPFFISPNGTDDFNPLSNIPWSSYRLMPLTTEELCMPLNEIPHNYYLKFKEESIKQQNCFVLTILLKFNLERDTQDLEKDVYLLNWLRCRLNSWFKEHKSRCMMVIENVVDKAFSKRHTSYTYSNDKESNCYTQAIPKIATAIFSVVSRSSDEKFRKQCFEMLQVDHARAIENAVTKRLWNIAEKRCGVAVPGDVQKIIEERYLNCDSDIVRCPDDGQVMEKYSFSDNESLRNYPAKCMLPVEMGETDSDWSLQTDVDTEWQLLSQLSDTNSEQSPLHLNDREIYQQLPVHACDIDSDWCLPVHKGNNLDQHTPLNLGDVDADWCLPVQTTGDNIEGQLPVQIGGINTECLPEATDNIFTKRYMNVKGGNILKQIPASGSNAEMQASKGADGYMVGLDPLQHPDGLIFSNWDSNEGSGNVTLDLQHDGPVYSNYPKRKILYCEDVRQGEINSCSTLQMMEDEEITVWFNEV